MVGFELGVDWSVVVVTLAENYGWPKTPYASLMTFEAS